MEAISHRVRSKDGHQAHGVRIPEYQDLKRERQIFESS